MKFQGRKLFLGSGTIELEKPIENVLVVRDRVIVAFQYDSYDDDDPNEERNVIAVDERGKFLWRIQRTPSAITDHDGSRMWNAYTGVTLERGGICAYDFDGICWKVDPETGEVSEPTFTK